MSGPTLPSSRDGELLLPPPSARSMLLTLVGEMLGAQDAPSVWTTALLQVLAGLGIEDHAARRLLARSAEAGWIDRTREGKAVRWHLAARGRDLVEEGIRRSNAYLNAEGHWDGRWLVLHVTVPQHQRTTRNRLYGGLDWLGLGNPVPGVWLTPHVDRAGDLRRLVADLGLEDTAFAVAGSACGVGMDDASLAMRSWELEDLADRYRRFIAREVSAPPPHDDDHLLLSFVDLLNLQQRFMRRDPMLPVELLPEWVGRDAAALFRELRERWSVRAHRRFWQIVDAAAP